MKRSLVFALALVSTGAFAQTLYSFESDLQGWADLAGDPVITLAQSTTGATNGTQAMSITWSGGFGWIGTSSTAGAVETALHGANQILMDITVDPGFVGQSNWANMLVAYNDGSYGWRQTGTSTTIPTAAGLHTVSVDVSAIQAPNLSNPWFQVFIGVNSANAGPRTMYVDNIRAVPEPASFIALGVGALALLRRRRAR
ncbi:MAG: PEP-CTERM sorting domain-containing protein [Fimbriimonadaceae bacterium]|nr:PEP-CTERM sorting domain-containing protein [Fimbriimonadaceae bacterium]